MTFTRRSLLASTAAGSAGAVMAGTRSHAQVSPAHSESSARATWLAIPQPAELKLRPGRWVPSAEMRLRLAPTTSAELRPEADRLRVELAEVAGVDPLPVTVAAGIDGAGDISLHLDDELGAEEFTVLVKPRSIRITGGSVAAVFYGSRQVMHNLRSQGVVPCAEVRSAPAVAERGLHIDMARKHYSMEWLRARARQLADLGFNTLQLHFSEHEGFRIASDMPGVTSTEFHTKEAIRELIDYAHTLHLQIIPALDMPGHLTKALSGYPEFQLMLPTGQRAKGALDVTNPEAVAWAKKLVDEYTELFHDSTVYMLAGDEFVPNMDAVPRLVDHARATYGPNANGHDALYGFVNEMYDYISAKGFEVRCWNDGMWRGGAININPAIDIHWWTNWSKDFKPVQAAPDHGHNVVNCNDGLMYYVLGQNAGYSYPTAEKFWARNWHPGVFPTLPPNGAAQTWPQPYPEWLIGSHFCIWSDRPTAQTEEQVAAGIRGPLRAKAERSWNAGSSWTLAEFTAVNDKLPDAP